MSPLSPPGLLWGLLLLLLLLLNDNGALEIGPRKTVSIKDHNTRQFSAKGIQNYSTMLLQEDLSILLVGARQVVYALDINNITIKKSSVFWNVTEADRKDCTGKSKKDTDCQNYIRVLHEVGDGKVYVCGTNAYSPQYGYMTYIDGQLTMEKTEDGKGQCPFDPFQRYSSVMVEGSLYSATSLNFLGSEPVVMRSFPDTVRSEFKITWLNEPSFVSMHHVEEGKDSPDGDEDKVYLFFSESAVEYDFYSKLTVSRVARVCKGDLGGQRTLQKKWTSFLKAQLDCPILDSRLPHLVQDVFLLKHKNWRDGIFYAVFTPQQDYVNHSAVCAYKVSDIGEVFSHGKFKTPVTVEASFVKWVMYSKDLPKPRPGACINNAAREQNVNTTLKLPDQTLRFVQDRPLMDQAVRPIGGRAQLVEKGTTFTRIVVDQVEALDGAKHSVMFIGTENGYLHKAVNYGGEMVVIEAMQLFKSPEPIRVLRLSSSKGLLYAGSDSGVVQMPVSECGRHASCLDCVLSRDPYCVWDSPASRCADLSGMDSPQSSDLIQSLKEGDPSRCPVSDQNSVKLENITLIAGSTFNLPCRPQSNLAQVSWNRDGRPLPNSPRYHYYSEGLMVLNAAAKDAGTYTCQSDERVKASTQGGSLALLKISVALLTLLLVGLLSWNVYRGHIPLLGPCRSGASEQDPGPGQTPSGHQDPASSSQAGNSPEDKPLMPVTNYSSNNNRLNADVSSNGEGVLSPKVTIDTFMFIDDESEI
ncbi:hypothetical protein SKAU_G00117610 [Synaphobranchus kaupii]|uniref:Semaphorin-4E n=1 Tax=Synaphobranchus kaupii TaxID=118154 RepID=A0A9Q1J260_SYNKA|nr:hypothetical protein SKAU_G00117610 [Synaphobranchus kaupii]